jgi:AraC-like DNA-binding protein
VSALPWLSGGGTIGTMVSPFLGGLSHILDRPVPGRSGGGRLGIAVLDALAAAFYDAVPAPTETSTRSLLVRAQAYIESHLPDPDLGCDSVAQALHVSVRYLQRAFELDDETVTGWIRARRLERCRRDLRDPHLATRPVSAVAARWGLINPAHFSRAFRAAYGVTPSDYRVGPGPATDAPGWLCVSEQVPCGSAQDGER